MGRVVLKSAQIDKSQSLISCAKERQQDICNVMMALESFTSDSVLTGDSYANAKEYIQCIYFPINKSLCMALQDEISANENVIACCNTYLNGIDLFDEDAILSEINRLQEEIYSLQDNWWESFPIVRKINSWRVAYNYLQIFKLNQYLQNLNDFDSATQGLHDFSNSQISTVNQKINAILSSAIFTGGKFNYSNIDMSWANALAQRWDESARSTELEFMNNMEKSYGFSSEQAILLKKAYLAIKDEYGNDLSNVELANKFWGIIASLCVNYDGKRWHMAANTDSYSNVKAQLKELGLTEQEILDLTVMINRQHGNISSGEFEEKKIEISNSKYKEKEYQDYQNLSEGYHKDFAHEAIQLAIFSNQLSPYDALPWNVRKNVLQGLCVQKGPYARMLIDIANTSLTGKVYTKYESSFKGDIDSGRYDDGDFASDMDAISVYYNISQKGEDPFDALAQYNLDIESGDKNRAVEFLTAIGDGSEENGWAKLRDALDAKTIGSTYILGDRDNSKGTEYFLNMLNQEYKKAKGN